MWDIWHKNQHHGSKAEVALKFILHNILQMLSEGNDMSLWHHCCKPTTGRFSGGNSLVWVLAEDVLDDDNGLLHHIVDLGLDEIQQSTDTALG